MTRWVAFAIPLLALAPVGLRAESSKSEAAAAQVIAALEQRKADVISARLPGEDNRYVAVMRLGGTGLMLIEAPYPVPVLIDEKILQGDHRSVYAMLNSTPPKGRWFLQDLGAAGLHETRADGEPFDLIYDTGALWLKLDGDWRGQELSRDEYLKRFASADQRYAASLAALKNALASAEPPAQPR